MRSYEELLSLSGYAHRLKDFEDLLRILDRELRLITPSDPAGMAAADQTDVSAATGQKYYQLTHDYLITPLRAWLTRKQRETRRGRAELRLAERAVLWNLKPQNRLLPSSWEHFTIRLLTRKRSWDDAQRKMMHRASVVHGLRAASITLLIALLAWVGFETFGTVQADALVEQIATARTADLPNLVGKLEGYRRWTTKPLQKLIASDNPGLQWRGRVAMLPVDAVHVEYVKQCLLTAAPDEVAVLRQSLSRHAEMIREDLWQIAEDSSRDSSGELLRAASALACFDPDSPRWNGISARVVSALVSENSLHATVWMSMLHPIRQQLLEPLVSVFSSRDGSYALTQRDLATDILEIYGADRVDILAEAILAAEPEQFVKLFDTFSAHGDIASHLLQAELTRELSYHWPDAPLDPRWPAPALESVEQLVRADGMLDERFACCQTLPLDQVESLCQTLKESGYYPFHVRPYDHEGTVRVAAVWKRGRRDYHFGLNLSAEEVLSRDEEMRDAGLRATDVAGYVIQVEGSKLERYCGVWCQSLNEDRRIYVAGTKATFHSAYESIDKAGFDKPVSVQAFEGSDGQQKYCGVRSNGNAWSATKSDCTSESFGHVEYLSMSLFDLAISHSGSADALETICRREVAAAEVDLQEKPDDLDAHLTRARALFWLDDFAEAVTEFDWLIARADKGAAFYRFRAMARSADRQCRGRTGRLGPI